MKVPRTAEGQNENICALWVGPIVSVPVTSTPTALAEGSGLRGPGSAPPASPRGPPPNLNKEILKEQQKKEQKEKLQGSGGRGAGRGAAVNQRHRENVERRGNRGGGTEAMRWPRGSHGEKGRKPAGSAHPGPRLLGYIPPQPSSEDPETPAAAGPRPAARDSQSLRSSQPYEAQPRLPALGFPPAPVSLRASCAGLPGWISVPPAKSLPEILLVLPVLWRHSLLLLSLSPATPDSKGDVRKGTPNDLYYLFL